MSLHTFAGPVRRFAAPEIEPPPRPADQTAELESRFAAAERRGFDAGHAAGLAAGAAEVAAVLAEHSREVARMRAAAAALEAAGTDLATRDAAAVADVERQVVELAVELAVATLGRELTKGPKPVLDALRRAAPLVPDRGTPVVRVHPDVVTVVAEHLAAGDHAPVWRGAHVVGDPAVAPEGCVVDVGACRIDAQLDTAVARLRQALA